MFEKRNLYSFRGSLNIIFTFYVLPLAKGFGESSKSNEVAWFYCYTLLVIVTLKHQKSLLKIGK